MKSIAVKTLICIWACVAFTGLARGADLPGHPDDFPVVEKLPDPFLFLDGSRVKTKEDWARRRAEIKDLVLRIEYGHLPEVSGDVRLDMMFSQKILNDGITRLEKHLLSMGPERGIRAQLDLYFPAKKEGTLAGYLEP